MDCPELAGCILTGHPPNRNVRASKGLVVLHEQTNKQGYRRKLLNPLPCLLNQDEGTASVVYPLRLSHPLSMSL